MKILLSLGLTLVFMVSFVSAQKADQMNRSFWAKQTLKKMTLRQKIGQMINFRLSGEFANFESDKFKEAADLVEKHGIGGFTVYRGNVNSISMLTNELQRRSIIPLHFAADYERGLRMQLPTGTPFTTAMGLGATGDTKAAYRQGAILCDEMRAIGVNWLFGPVADLNNNPDNPVINIRSYGADPAKAAEFVVAVSQGLQSRNCMSTLKHFPGHGDTASDSHIGLSVVDVDQKRLDEVELVPFKAAIDKGADSVMTAHVTVPKVTGDGLPATLSPKISTDLLRKKLGFKGIIITDGMEMGAIEKNFEREKSVVYAVLAGADVILLPPSVGNAIDAIESAVKGGVITEARINESVLRILESKHRLGLAKKRFVDTSMVNRIVEKPANVADANAVAEKSVTLLRNAGAVLPISAEKASKTLFVVIAADDDPVQGATLIPEIQRRLPNAKIHRLDLRTTAEEYEKVLKEAGGFENVLLAPFVKRAANKGTVALPEKQALFVRNLLKTDRKVAVVAFGSPYLIRQFPEAKTYAVTYAIEEIAQYAAAKAIFGEIKFTGRLPVAMPGLFEIGSGLTP